MGEAGFVPVKVKFTGVRLHVASKLKSALGAGITFIILLTESASELQLSFKIKVKIEVESEFEK